MSGLLVTLPLHLACQLISSGNLGYENVTYVDDTSVLSQNIRLPEGYTAFPDVGLAYKYYVNRLPWNSARKQCITEGGHLAVIDSFKKVGYLHGIKDKSASVHVGYHRLFNSVDWISVKSGQTPSFIPWKSDAKLAAGTGDCVALSHNGSGLAPSVCTNALPAICEISLFENYRNRAQMCRTTPNVPSTDVEIVSSSITSV